MEAMLQDTSISDIEENIFSQRRTTANFMPAKEKKQAVNHGGITAPRHIAKFVTRISKDQ